MGPPNKGLSEYALESMRIKLAEAGYVIIEEQEHRDLVRDRLELARALKSIKRMKVARVVLE